MTVDRVDAETTPDARAAGEVFYDGGCPVCRREIAWYTSRRGGRDMRWTDVTDPASAPRFPAGFSRDDLLSRFTVQRKDGAVVTGAAGFLAIWQGLAAFRPLGRLVDNRVGVWLGDQAYWLFLRLRPLWRRSR